MTTSRVTKILALGLLVCLALLPGCKKAAPVEAREAAEKFLRGWYNSDLKSAVDLASGDAYAMLLGVIRPPQYTLREIALKNAEGNRDGNRWTLVYKVTWELGEEGRTYLGQHEVTLDLMKFEDGWKVYSFLWAPLPKT